MKDLQRQFSKWCVWIYGKKRSDGKPAKVPINPRNGKHANTKDPDSFGTFDEAQAAQASRKGGRYKGLGVLMAGGPGAVCVDIDNCLSADGTPNEIAEWALNNFAGFCEVSQSGRGLHFFMLATKPAGCAQKKTVAGESLEIYGADNDRYICVTGEKYIEESRESGIVAEQAALDRFIEHFGFMPVTPGEPSGTGTTPDTDDEEHSDEEILGLLRRRNKRGSISRLFAGDLKDRGGDHSAADLALCAEIAYYTAGAEQVERIFGTSELAKREKWERVDYRKCTINKALATCKGYYWDKDKGKRGNAGSAEVAAASAGLYASKLTGGTEGLTLTQKGKLASNIYNAVQVLLRDHRAQGAVAFNLFSGAVEVLRPLRDVFGAPASDELGDFREVDVTVLRTWLIREYGIQLGKDDALDVVMSWSRHVAFNPVTDALTRLADAWDGKARLNSWLQDIFGVDSEGIEAYVCAVGRCWVIASRSRVGRSGLSWRVCRKYSRYRRQPGNGASLARRAYCRAIRTY